MSSTKRRPLFRLLGVLVLAVVLPACTSGPGNRPAFEAAAGTFDYANNLGTSFLLVLRPPDGNTEVIPVSITGPADWNSGQPIERVYTSGQPLEARSGAYTITATIGGKDYTRVLQVDTSKTISVIKSITQDELSSTEVLLSWLPVEGAASYFVELEDPALPQGFRRLYTAGPSAHFTGMQFQDGKSYALRITAFTADLTVGTELQAPHTQFNTSYIAAILTYP